jgi:hypothetical protein
MKRIKLPLDESCLAWKYANNALLIGYDKPDQILELERKKQSDIKNLGK